MLALLLASGTAGAAGLSPDLRRLDRIPLLVAPTPVIDKSLSEALPRKDRPLQFAVPVTLALTQAGGLWDEVTPGTSRWRARVTSGGAHTLHFHLSNVQLPEGATLWVYDPVANAVQGPYTSADLTAGELWTAAVLGDAAILEARMPSAKRGAFALNVADLQYGFLDWPKAGSFGGPDAGGCEVDVACSQGDEYRPEIRSVALLQYVVGSASVLCSGTLVNDVPQDNKPLVITAGHCEITTANAPQLNVYWLNQKAACGAGSEDISHTQHGSTHKLTDTHSDLTLLQLAVTPASSFDVYYSGWDASGGGAQCGVGIHHPEGDVKKISIYTQPVIHADVDFNGTTVNTWKVFWARAVTEEGSSGSGLWNQDHHMIGVLHGGGSNCAHQSDPDFYGRLDVAWSNGLQAQLDPANTGATSLCGRNPGGVCTNVQTQCTVLVAAAKAGLTEPNVGGGGALAPGLLLGLLLLNWRRRGRRARGFSDPSLRSE